MNFSTKSEHAIPYFINLNILPVHFLNVESVSCLMYDIQNKLAPVHIQNLFKNAQIYIPTTPGQQPPTNFT